MEKARKILCLIGVGIGWCMSIYPAISTYVLEHAVSEGSYTWLVLGGMALLTLASFAL
ncbi:MAG TPA: hypothetical protein VN665_01330 [Candidatus Paceibacterota bacterium]|nr:hypothetical protein [Candidatus Paceibacterota bacterium]